MGFFELFLYPCVYRVAPVVQLRLLVTKIEELTMGEVCHVLKASRYVTTNHWHRHSLCARRSLTVPGTWQVTVDIRYLSIDAARRLCLTTDSIQVGMTQQMCYRDVLVHGQLLVQQHHVCGNSCNG